MTTPGPQNHAHPTDPRRVARRAMGENGFEVDFSPEVQREVEAMLPALPNAPATVRDLRELLWSSIDNDESRDLDQIEVAERLPNGDIRVLVGVADVDSRVPRGSPIDQRASTNTTSVYTGVAVFPMLPERLSTDLTSLNQDVERLAIVTELTVRSDGSVAQSDVYRARVRNHAKLAYDGVGGWLEGTGPAPAKVAESTALQEQLRLQDEAAQRLKEFRHGKGAVDLESLEAQAVTRNGQLVDLKLTPKSRSRELIEDFMIAANGVMARFLEAHGRSSLARIVRKPKRWDRIIALAATYGETLPADPSSAALSAFLAHRRTADPAHFPDLSLAVVKLMGPGEYALQKPGAVHTGHFGLAVQDYSHSTAPNRRFADLITQRLLKATLNNEAAPYSDEALTTSAERCTQKEHDAQKVERLMRKVAAAVVLRSHIGETFDAIVTGAADKGTFVRLIDPPAEGRVVRGETGMNVGDRVRVRLTATDPEKGFIDFVRA